MKTAMNPVCPHVVTRGHKMNQLRSSTMFIDWLSLTTKEDRVDVQENIAYTLAGILGGQWLECRGRNGYRKGLKHVTGAVILWDGLAGMGVHVVLNGDALAFFGDVVNELVHSYDFSCSRIDIAYDSDSFTVDDVIDGRYVAVVRASRRTLVHDISTGAKTLYLGSLRGGRKLIRIYDKAKEQGLDGVLTRVEIQLREEYADAAFRHLLGGGDIKDIAGRAVSFRVPGGARKNEWRPAEWWQEALRGAVGGFSFPCRQGVCESIEKVRKWIEKYVAYALAKCHVVYGDAWLRGMLYRASYRVDFSFCST